MCGRFSILKIEAELADAFDAFISNDLPELPNTNVCPSTQICTITSQEGQRRIQSMRWGFLPSWYKSLSDGPLLINARSETIAEKPAFREACRQRRCIIPASGFYEWNREGDEKLPWYISPKADAFMGFAGVWQSWGEDQIQSCAIVTTDANDTLRPIHHRMPVILDAKDWALWLGENGKGAARLMRPAPDDALQAWRVDQSVNSNRAQGPHLITPISSD